MKFPWLAGAMLVFSVAGAAVAAGTAPREVQASGSSISFVFKQENVPVTGGFRRFSGKIALDPGKPQNSSVQMQFDVSSITAGSEDADTEVIKPGWFNAAAFPQARFVSNSVKSSSPGHWQADGALTIKGITRNVSVPFEARDKPDGTTELAGQFELKRADYKLGEGEWSVFDTVANEVSVKFRVLLAPAAAVKK